MRAYYDARASEYDEWYESLGRFDGLERAHWDDELSMLAHVLTLLPPMKTIDVACGTGFLTRHVRGEITGLDQSPGMLALAARRVPDASFVRADAFSLSFPDRSFERVLTGHFYGHLRPRERDRFLRNARRVAPELVVVDSALRPDRAQEGWQERVLNDGSRWRVYKRYFEPGPLAAELGGGEILLAGRWFVVVRSPA